MKITDNIKNILEQGKFEENIYKLPDVQLDRKDYKEVNDILMTLGWKWKTRVWHIFSWEQEELEEALFEVLENGETETLTEIKKRFQYYPTPSKLARELVELAEIKEDDNILEPSAGQGAIVDEILKEEYWRLTLIELDKKNVDILKEKYTEIKGWIFVWDFLEDSWDINMYNKILLNPPFSKNQDVKHILKAYSLLADWWRIVAIAASNILNKTTKLHEELKALNPEQLEVEEWAFKDSWTMINTCILVINK